MARTPRRSGTHTGSGRRASSGRRPQGRGTGSVGGGPRGSVRPGAAATPRGSSPTGPGRFAKSSTKRLAVLGGILVILALMLVPTLRGYLGQRAQINALQEEVAQRTQAVDQLERDLERWDDPAYIEQQARHRLKFVRPGETSYQVLDAEGLTGSAMAESGSVVRPNEAADSTWYGRVWSSLDAADSLSPKDVNAPLAPIAPDAGATPPPTPGAPGAPGTPATATGESTGESTGGSATATTGEATGAPRTQTQDSRLQDERQDETSTRTP